MTTPQHGFVARALARHQFVRFILDEGGNPFGGLILSAAILSGSASALVLASLNGASNALATGKPSLLMAAAFGASLVVYVGATQYLLRASGREIERSTHKLRCRLVDKLCNASFRSVEEIGGSKLYAAIGGEVQTICRAATSIILLLQSVILLFFSSVYLAYISVMAFFLLLGFVVVVGSIYNSHARQLRVVLFEAMQGENRLLEFLVHFLNGFREIRMNAGRAGEITSDFKSASLRSYEDKANAFAAIATDNVFAQASMFLLIACVVFLLPQFSAGVMPELPMIATVLLFMFGPIASVMTSESTFAAANAAAKSLAETEQLLEADISVRERSAIEVSAFQGLVLQDIVYCRLDKAGSESFRVGPVSLEVRPGEIVFITGGNGSGKSTLLNVLVGLYPRDSGEILVAGRALTNAEIWRWQAQVSAVFYSFHLFEKPYGLRGRSMEDVLDLIDELELDRDVLTTDGYFRSLALSSGQRKRLALITAILEDRPVLVLDEWAADQDPYFKRKFYREILPMLKRRGKTIIAITHDDAYFDVADRVMKMESGQMVELAAR